ncbi:MAG: sigma-70 family RNA polymerase sigma factor [Ruminococcus sp.]|nr:sigma-70 family RNA polymerase sigma factor [Ruminococcus sp.]MCM1382572.1 sigma-70 family RNA polymerase sigma factor [Muribaculaceae bacterium]MCM1479026.1 sigma-70 family RNA polymerase sigma factor [Muribaculaceae bacterium]
MTDTEIIGLYQARNETAITESNAKYGAYCFAVAENILNNREDSGECVNDTWLYTWNVIPPKRPDRLKLFFAKITRHLSIDRLRKLTAKRRGEGQLALALEELEECVPDGSRVEDTVDERRLGGIIDEFLRTVPTRERQFFLRRYFYTEAVSAIAERFGVSENAVSVSLYRTRAKLKERLEQEGFEV